MLLLGHFIIFLGLKIFFAADKTFLVQTLVLLERTLFAARINVELYFLGFVVQLVLLHGDLCIAEQVLLFSQFRLRIQNLQIQVGVTETKNHVAFLHVSSFFHHLFLHDTSLFGTKLYHGNRLHLPVHTDIVIELSISHVGNVQRFTVDFQCRSMIAENNPAQQQKNNGSSPNIRKMFLLDSFFLF